MRNGWISVLLVASSCALAFGAGPKVPILYSTDLFHPHADPDDHYDLACLFAMPELDVRGVLLDLGAEQAKRCGRPAVEQMMHLAGRKVPCAVGLSRPLRSRTDTATDEPKEFQGAVDLILSVLRESNEKVCLFTTGSCRVAIDRDGRRLDGYFQFYAPGEHEVEVVYEDGSRQSARFQVPQVDPLGLRIVLDPANPNGFVFRSTHPRYKQIMASCLKNLLADLGR